MKIKHEYVCDECGKPATVRLQTSYQLCDITTDGNFEQNDEWLNDVNEFFCNKCKVFDLDAAKETLKKV